MNTPTPIRRRALAALLTAVGLLACRADTGDLDTLTVAQLSGLLAGDGPVVVLDANTDETRAKLGVIPGATLLTSYRDYDLAGELPTALDVPLVFYCHSARCGAAVAAAERAVAAGHLEVAVLPDGITGWIDSGARLASPAAAGGGAS